MDIIRNYRIHSYNDYNISLSSFVRRTIIVGESIVRTFCVRAGKFFLHRIRQHIERQISELRSSGGKNRNINPIRFVSYAIVLYLSYIIIRMSNNIIIIIII